MNASSLISSKLIKKPVPVTAAPSLLKCFSATTVEISRFPPDLSTCITSLQACALHKNLSKGRQIHSFMLVSGLLSSPLSITSLINMYSKCNHPAEALAIFDGTHGRNLFSWNAIIAGFVHNGLPHEALEFYRRLRWENVVPDKFTFPCAITACSELSEVLEARKIHGGLFKTGLEIDPFVASALINFYLKFSFMEEARSLFEELPTRDDVVLWNSMINGYAQIGEFPMALDVFSRMNYEGVTPNKFTVTGILSVSATTEDLNNGTAIHAFVEKMGYESGVAVSNSLIDMYGKCKSVEDALQVFEIMPEKDIFSWNSIISVHEQSGDYGGTLRFFDRMRDAGLRPDTVTITAILPACSNMAALMHGREIHGYMIVNGLRMASKDGKNADDVYVENAVMDMYAKCGSLRDARLVFDKMWDKDVASWNIMIMGYGLHGYGDKALDMFSQMCEAQVKPDEVTFVGVLSACSHAGLVGSGREFLARMHSDYGVIPSVEHYACVVDMLGRGGLLNEAYELMVTMPMVPNSVVWRAFLAACRLHGNSSLGEVAAKRIFELDPEHCGSYVLISNIYGDIGRYEEVSEVRQSMRQSKVRKTPGCSWIELKNGVHVFITRDQTHPQSDMIYAELDALTARLREHGYVPLLQS